MNTCSDHKATHPSTAELLERLAICAAGFDWQAEKAAGEYRDYYVDGAGKPDVGSKTSGQAKRSTQIRARFPTSASLKQWIRAHDFVSEFTPLTVAALQHNFLRFVQAVTASFGNASSHERRHERACFVGSRRGRHVYCHLERGPRSCVGRISDYCGDLSQAGSFRGVPLQSARRCPTNRGVWRREVQMDEASATPPRWTRKLREGTKTRSRQFALLQSGRIE